MTRANSWKDEIRRLLHYTPNRRAECRRPVWHGESTTGGGGYRRTRTAALVSAEKGAFCSIRSGSSSEPDALIKERANRRSRDGSLLKFQSASDLLNRAKRRIQPASVRFSVTRVRRRTERIAVPERARGRFIEPATIRNAVSRIRGRSWTRVDPESAEDEQCNR